MIRTRGLVKRYGSFTAVDGVDLNVLPGQIHGFLGPNGAGKTTTMMMLLGITRPTDGEIWLFGERADPGRLDLRRRIGVVPEKHPRGVWSWMSALEYLELFADLFKVPRPRARIASLLAKVDLEAAAGRRLRELSHGMLQKLSFVRALLPDPDILLLDEPISGLDPIGIKQARDLIVSESREGRAILISSHQLSEMERICGRVAIMDHGRLVAEDSMEGLLARISADREIRVELERVPPGLVEAVGRLPFVRGARADGATLVVRIAREGDQRKALAEALIRDGHVPLGMEESVPSLEEAFMAIAGGQAAAREDAP
jgi:ABC-type multidrug transport system ATPase subunit